MNVLGHVELRLKCVPSFSSLCMPMTVFPLSCNKFISQGGSLCLSLWVMLFNPNLKYWRLHGYMTTWLSTEVLELHSVEQEGHLFHHIVMLGGRLTECQTWGLVGWVPGRVYD